MFPAIVVCILVRFVCNKDCQPQFSLSVRVDGIEWKFASEPVSVLTMDIDHIYLCDLQSILHHPELPKIDEWNQAEVSVQQQFGILKKEVMIKYTGVHVYKQENNMENIRFTKPNPPKRTYLDFCISNNDLEPDFFPSLKVQKQLDLLNSISPTGCATLSKSLLQCLSCTIKATSGFRCTIMCIQASFCLFFFFLHYFVFFALFCYTLHDGFSFYAALLYYILKYSNGSILKFHVFSYYNNSYTDYLRRMEISKQIGDDKDTVMLQNLKSLGIGKQHHIQAQQISIVHGNGSFLKCHIFCFI